MNDKIVIKGVNQHNLKNIDLELPKNELIVFTGVSGSGKTTLVLESLIPGKAFLHTHANFWDKWTNRM